MENTLSVEARAEKGKGAARKIRRQGKIPGVMYGHGNNQDLTLDPRVLTRYLLQEGGKNNVYSLTGGNLDGKKAMIKDYQVHPVTRDLMHVDLLEIDATEKVLVKVAVNFTGKPAGVVNGGVMNVVDREIEVNCFPDRIPGHIDIDVSALNIGDSIHAEDVKLPEGVERNPHANPTLVTVVPPAKEEEAAPTEAAEPEVIKEKKKDDASGGDKDKK